MFERLIKYGLWLALLWLLPAQAEVAVSAARLWPAQDYTRLTLESKQAISYNMFTLDNPQRLVVDLENVALDATLNELGSKVSGDDPYIGSLRIGRFKAGVVRLVFDLKAEIKPQLFSLKPVGDYGHRLVLDVYPAIPADPLMALAEQMEQKLGASAPAPGVVIASPEPAQIPAPAPPPELRNRLFLVAIDAGHGGEDPRCARPARHARKRSDAGHRAPPEDAD